MGVAICESGRPGHRPAGRAGGRPGPAQPAAQPSWEGKGCGELGGGENGCGELGGGMFIYPQLLVLICCTFSQMAPKAPKQGKAKPAAKAMPVLAIVGFNSELIAEMEKRIDKFGHIPSCSISTQSQPWTSRRVPQCLPSAQPHTRLVWKEVATILAPGISFGSIR